MHLHCKQVIKNHRTRKWRPHSGNFISSILEVVQFLAVNKLALRGDYSTEKKSERGFKTSLFKFIIKKVNIIQEYLNKKCY